MITTHYLDQYPFGCEDVGRRRQDGPALICTLAPLAPLPPDSTPNPSTGGRGACRSTGGAALPPALVSMATNGRGGSCGRSECRG